MRSTRLWLAAAATAVFATLGPAFLPGSISTIDHAIAAKKKAPIVCMTDEGYGRYRPCDSFYKTSNPNWRGGDNCYTDEGYGRYRPCDSFYKSKHKKK